MVEFIIGPSGAGKSHIVGEFDSPLVLDFDNVVREWPKRDEWWRNTTPDERLIVFDGHLKDMDEFINRDKTFGKVRFVLGNPYDLPEFISYLLDKHPEQDLTIVLFVPSDEEIMKNQITRAEKGSNQPLFDASEIASESKRFHNLKQEYPFIRLFTTYSALMEYIERQMFLGSKKIAKRSNYGDYTR